MISKYRCDNAIKKLKKMKKEIDKLEKSIAELLADELKEFVKNRNGNT